MKKSRLIDVALWILLSIGFFGAVSISYSNLSGNPCPYIWVVPICYVVLIAYGLMIASLVVPHIGCKHYFFIAGWGTAFLIALAGSLAEMLSGGGVCPTSGGGSIRGGNTGSIPMCYISLALTIGILLLFLIGPYRRVCDVYEQSNR